MGAVYSIRMFMGVFGDAPPVTVATVPAGFIWVVRSVQVRARGASDIGTWALEVNVPNGPIGFIMGAPSLAPLTTADWEGRQVLYAGESLVVRVSSQQGNTDWICSGYQLSA